MLERDIQKSVVSYARRNDVIAHKFSSEARRNVPDYIFLFDGRIYFIEFKATGQVARAGQQREINKLKAAGFKVDVCDDKSIGKLFINMFIQDAFY